MSYVLSVSISTFILEVFYSELQFADSLRREQNQSGARRAVTDAVTTAAVEAKHACTSATDIVAAAEEPGITRIREVGVI